MVTPHQIETARLGLRMTRAELAQASGVSERTIVRMEKPKAKGGLSANRDKIVKHLERLGVQFFLDGSVSVPPSNGG